MSKHTPGPWESRVFLVVGGERMTDRICHVGSSTNLPPSRSHESEANARLIGAAPEMLEALLELVDSAVILGGDEVVSKEAMDKVRAAIIKAEGCAAPLDKGGE